jgi:hypothetical protein
MSGAAFAEKLAGVAWFVEGVMRVRSFFLLAYRLRFGWRDRGALARMDMCPVHLGRVSSFEFWSGYG